VYNREQINHFCCLNGKLSMQSLPANSYYYRIKKEAPLKQCFIADYGKRFY